MGWFTKLIEKPEPDIDADEFLHILKHGEGSNKAEYRAAKDQITEASEVKHRIQKEIESKLDMAEHEHFIIYDYSHHECEKSEVGYCGTIRNWKTAEWGDKNPCIWCESMV